MSVGDFGGLLPLAPLTAWLDDRLPGRGEGFEVTPIESGTSNAKFVLARAGRRYVLRRPPAVPISPTAHDVSREVRVLRALDGSDVPHPQVLAACDDPGVIGAPFYVMEFVEGFTPQSPLPPPFASDTKERRGLGLALLDGIAGLAQVDWRARGLAGFGRPEGFLERQVARWLGQLEKVRTRELPGLARVARWLEASRPAMGEPAILHGDYQFVNVIFAHGAPAKLAAILDWEQCTIGDPLLDLGWLLAGWSDPGEPMPFTGYLNEREGLPTRAELAARYAGATGRDVSALPYYRVLALFKLACIMEGAFYTYTTGRNRKADYAQLESVVPRFLADAERILEGAC